MKNTIIFISLLFTMLLFGCADIRHALKNPFALDSPLVGKYMEKAAEFEKQGELQLALKNWEIIYNLTPDKASTVKKITELKQAISQKADEHLNKGVALLKQKKIDLSQKEFLMALRLNPDLSPALGFLKKETEKGDAITYKVTKGDTFKRIAQKVYNDPTKDFLIRSLSNAGSNEGPLQGTLLILPYLEKQYKLTLLQKKAEKEAAYLKEKKIEEDLALSKDYFENQEYDKMLTIAECILEEDPENDEAYDLTIDAYYQLGKQFKKTENYLSSLEMFQKLDPEYKDVKKLKSNLHALMKNQSEIYYRQGLKYFINEDLQKAITEWEKALVLNPSNVKIERDIKNARELIEKLKKIK